MFGFKVVGGTLKGSNDYQYSIGGISRQKGTIRLCKNGLHYSARAMDADQYGLELLQSGKLVGPRRYLVVYDKEKSENRDIGHDKIATRSLKVVCELSRTEWLQRLEVERDQEIRSAEVQASAMEEQSFRREFFFLCSGVVVVATAVFVYCFFHK